MSDVSEIGAQIVIDRRVGLRVGIGLAIYFAVQLFALGYTYATGEWRLTSLETAKDEEKKEALLLKAEVKAISERTIRMEEKLGFVLKAVEGRPRP